jgi:hypothetical protein
VKNICISVHICTGSFSKTEVIKPNLNILEKFHNMVETKFNKIFSNQKQIRTLQSLPYSLMTFFSLSIAGYPDFTAHEFG